MNTWLNQGRLRRPGRGLKKWEKLVESKSTNRLEHKNPDTPLSVCVCCSRESRRSVQSNHTLLKSIYCWVACTATESCSSKRCSTFASLNTSLNSFGQRVSCFAMQMRRHASTKFSMAAPKCFR